MGIAIDDPLAERRRDVERRLVRSGLVAVLLGSLATVSGTGLARFLTLTVTRAAGTHSSLPPGRAEAGP